MSALTTILILVTLTSYGQEKKPIKLGLGIVAIDDTYDESKTVTVYKDKSLKTKIEDLNFMDNLKAFGHTTSSRTMDSVTSFASKKPRTISRFS